MKTLLFAILVIVLFNLSVFVLHLISKTCIKLFLYFTYSYLGKVLDGLLFGTTVDILKFVVVKWTACLQLNINSFDKDVVRVINCFVTLISTDVRPRRLD